VNVYDAIYLTAVTALLPVLAHEHLRHGKYRESIPGMFGARLPRPPLPEIGAGRERVWMHSVSVGETIGAGAVFRLLRARHPDWEFVSTTTTETGHAESRRALREANHHDYAPFDFSWTVRRFLDAYRPTVYLFFESELWPNRLLECARRGARIFLLNGSLSAKSARRYRLVRCISQRPMSRVRAFLMQSPEHAERIRCIAGTGRDIHVTGNVKFDSLPEPLSPAERSALRRGWGIDDRAFVVMAGSTHPGEEQLVHAAFERLRARMPEARLIIAPRNPERFAAVAGEFALHRLSCGPSGGAPALLLDQMGVLARGYGAADLALVGGAWNPIGGHNLLEPAAHAVPVIHGPGMHKQPDIHRIMRDATLEVSEDGLADEMLALALAPERRAALGRRRREAARQNQGAAARTVETLEGYLA